jgi:hypothetical protein
MPQAMTDLEPIPSPTSLRRKFDELNGRRRAVDRTRAQRQEELARVSEYLALAPAVDDAIDQLSKVLFQQLTTALEQSLTYALQEILGQSIQLKVKQDFDGRSGVKICFHIERDGQAEDIMRGQGGSVANILSVGLRIFALSRLPEKQHRRFLVLDEQDCWLAPDLVPRLVRIVHDAGKQLGFQVLMISHHDTRSFDQYADRIYEFAPTPTGVSLKLLQSERKSSSVPDPSP